MEFDYPWYKSEAPAESEEEGETSTPEPEPEKVSDPARFVAVRNAVINLDGGDSVKLVKGEPVAGLKGPILERLSKRGVVQKQ